MRNRVVRFDAIGMSILESSTERARRRCVDILTTLKGEKAADLTTEEQLERVAEDVIVALEYLGCISDSLDNGKAEYEAVESTGAVQ